MCHCGRSRSLARSQEISTTVSVHVTVHCNHCAVGGGGGAMKQLSLLHGEIKVAAGQLAGMNAVLLQV